jgi:hypothetical protein
MADRFHRVPGAGFPLTPALSRREREKLRRRFAPRLDMYRVAADRFGGFMHGFGECRVRVNRSDQVL